MAICNRESKLCDILMSHPQLIPVINRLGINLGTGDGTIGEICEERNIDSKFFLSVVNTFLDEDYFPSNAKDVFTLEKTIDYLEKTGSFYLDIQLPNIERHFNRLIQMSGPDNNLELLRHFFLEMKKQFSDNILYEKEILFPDLRNNIMPQNSPYDLGNSISEVEEKLQDLLIFFVAHLKGRYDGNLCMAVVTSVFSLFTDICQNNRIRRRILIPLLEKISEK